MKDTYLMQALGITHPVIQAPMAGVSTPELAAAVSNAGGLGSIGLGASSPDAARRMIGQTQALTDKAFNVNVFCHVPAVRNADIERTWLEYLAPKFGEFETSPPTHLDEIYKSFIEDDDMLALLLELKPRVVSFHFGLPSQDKINALRAAGIFLMATATSEDEAAQIEAAGIDAIVAQGIEAGGHRGCFDSTMHDSALPALGLLKQLAAQADIPVIAAGGLMNGSDINEAMRLGASAAQLGTAFILCPESAADSAYRAALQSDRAHDTRLTDVISGRPARGLRNGFIKDFDIDGKPAVPAYPVTYDAGKALHAAAKAAGNFDYAAHWAGQRAPLARSLPAALLVAVLVTEMKSADVT